MESVEGVELFKYMGGILHQSDVNCTAVLKNIQRLRQVWGAFREVTTAIGGRPDHLSKVLPSSGSSGVTIWGRYPGADGSNGSEARGFTCGLPVSGDRAEDAMYGEQFLVEGRGVKYALGGRDKTFPDLP